LQSDLVWVEEGYPTAAAIQLLHGKTLYRDIWFDKPPLFAATYLLWGARTGIALRLGGAIFVLACCWMLFRFGRDVWGEREGMAAAAMLGIYLTFGIPSAVMALAPDLLMILPHTAAIYLAWRGRPFWSGLMAGIAMLVNTKAVFVLAACAVWQSRALIPLISGFLLPNIAALGWMGINGSLGAYYEQVWNWGWIYSRETFVEHPVAEGLLRTINWAGFQAAAVAGSVWWFWRERNRPALLWMVISMAGVAAGWRFFPRYYLLLLPPICLLAARAFTTSRMMRIAMLVLLTIPVIRFGPRLVNHRNWSDLAMMDDSRAAAAMLDGMRKQNDTLLVWGYRPDIFAFTQMAAGTRFLDSQPLTGVIADRHLTRSDVVAPELAAANRRELAQTSPSFIVDGLGPYNPQLALTNYADLKDWFAKYRPVGKTVGTIIYMRADLVREQAR
jgi:F0F1-type ATP synthase assembly protein I